ncbi:GntR family transcriptional regulator [Krasilnikovia cinnamomea]|uniref:GntR family transcriptional regulator n=1 Tax=Krasilnikovia cinnamomea TaxID=349313 RepID=A0A4Q7ZIK4_9ACTN|nr:GntR family transcriptional regulator [Krasilnikovia cinnamomea]
MRPPAYQMLADELRTEITSGRLRPGERLPPEPELCIRSGVSRSTVREALRLLASQHLIITTRGVTGGSFVAHPDAAQICEGLTTGLTLLTNSATVGFTDVLELRTALEVPAAAMAAHRRTDTDVAFLRAAMFDPAGDDDARMCGAAAAFHAAVCKATRNPLFELVTRPVYDASCGDDVIRDLPEGYWAEVDRDHRELLARILARDPDGAATAARIHLEHVAEANRRSLELNGDHQRTPATSVQSA